jgi:uncharacterized MnhB-related membrane protein
MIQEIFLIFLVILSILVVVSKDLLRSLVFLSVSTILLVLLLFILQAPDVAITMAVIGTGATTILYLTVIKKVRRLK